jgi:hypothetical protein
VRLPRSSANAEVAQHAAEPTLATNPATTAPTTLAMGKPIAT